MPIAQHHILKMPSSPHCSAAPPRHTDQARASVHMGGSVSALVLTPLCLNPHALSSPRGLPFLSTENCFRAGSQQHPLGANPVVSSALGALAFSAAADTRATPFSWTVPSGTPQLGVSPVGATVSATYFTSELQRGRPASSPHSRSCCPGSHVIPSPPRGGSSQTEAGTGFCPCTPAPLTLGCGGRGVQALASIGLQALYYQMQENLHKSC